MPDLNDALQRLEPELKSTRFHVPDPAILLFSFNDQRYLALNNGEIWYVTGIQGEVVSCREITMRERTAISEYMRMHPSEQT